MGVTVRTGVIAVAGIGIGVLAWSQLLQPPPSEPPAPVAPIDGPRPGEATRSPYRPIDSDPSLAGVVQRLLEPPPDPPPKLPPSVARQAAEASFDGLMQALENLADDDSPVTKARRFELYHDVTSSFAALSAQLDPNNAEDMHTLEDANQRMRSMLTEVGIERPHRKPMPLTD